MIKSKKILVTLFATFFVVCFVGMAEAENNPVAEVMVDSSGINFMPRVNFARLYISLSRADGSVIQKTFNSGSTPYLDLSTILGERPCDGLYTYELQVISAVVKRSRDVEGFSSKIWTPRAQEALTQTGYFTVRGGMIVTPGAIEPINVFSTSQDDLSRTQDQVILDDLIVDGSLCVGMDCVNGESFGFDTIRLKENNLRIRFVDTSSTSSFPSRDWQITVNDSANGGANKFSIDDIDGGRTPFTIEAGAPSHSLYVDDGGRLGLGTSTPVVDAHIKSGNTPTLRLEQDGSSGFTPQTWDVAGNEANFFVRDATNGSTLPFRIIPGAPSNSLYIKSDGKVGIGTSSPAYALEVETTAGNAAHVVVEQTNGARGIIVADSDHVFIGSKTDHDFRLIANDDAKITILQDGKIGIGVNSVNAAYKLEVDNGAHLTTGGAWINGSSKEYKDNIHELSADEAVEALDELNPVTFEYKKEKGEKYVGFIAEDVPELVAQNDRMSLSTMDIVAVLTKVVKEQQKTISELKKEIAELKKK